MSLAAQTLVTEHQLALTAILSLGSLFMCCCCCFFHRCRKSEHDDALLPKHMPRSEHRSRSDNAHCNESACDLEACTSGDASSCASLGPLGTTFAAPYMQTQQERAVTITSEDQEGGRGGGWGDLDSMDPSLTLARAEYPTSRRGADLDVGRQSTGRYHDESRRMRAGTPPVGKRRESPMSRRGAGRR